MLVETFSSLFAAANLVWEYLSCLHGILLFLQFWLESCVCDVENPLPNTCFEV